MRIIRLNVQSDKGKLSIIYFLVWFKLPSTYFAIMYIILTKKKMYLINLIYIYYTSLKDMWFI